MAWIILSVTAFIIVGLACYKAWIDYQATWRDMTIKRKEDDHDITNIVPLAMRKSEEGYPKWE